MEYSKDQLTIQVMDKDVFQNDFMGLVQIDVAKKRDKQKRKLRNEFGEDIKVGESNRKKGTAKKAQVNNVNDQLDLFES